MGKHITGNNYRTGTIADIYVGVAVVFVWAAIAGILWILLLHFDWAIGHFESCALLTLFSISWGPVLLGVFCLDAGTMG